MSTSVPSVEFNNELKCPILGLGTWKMGGRAHGSPDVKWLPEPIDIYNVNTTTHLEI